MKDDKTRNIIGWILSGIPLAILTFSAIGKIMMNEDLVANLNQLNINNNIPVLGILLLFCIGLYVYPKTSNIGFFLLCSYLGGVIVGEVALGESPLFGIGLATLFYAGTMIRRPDLSGIRF